MVNKTTLGHGTGAFGIVTLLSAVAGAAGASSFSVSLLTAVSLFAVGLAVGVYFGREVDQEQQKLVFNRTLKNPNITLKHVAFKCLLPWKWKSEGQRWDLYAAIIGATAGLFATFLL